MIVKVFFNTFCLDPACTCLIGKNRWDIIPKWEAVKMHTKCSKFFSTRFLCFVFKYFFENICNKTRTHNHLVRLNHLEWLSVRVLLQSLKRQPFRYRACFEQGVPWRSGNYRMWIRSETRTWHDKNIQLYF